MKNGHPDMGYLYADNTPIQAIPLTRYEATLLVARLREARKWPRGRTATWRGTDGTLYILDNGEFRCVR
jgi:hypothetical protein